MASGINKQHQEPTVEPTLEQRAPVQEVSTAVPNDDDVSSRLDDTLGPTLSVSSSFDSVGATSTLTESPARNKKAKQIRREQQRHRLLALAHAATCHGSHNNDSYSNESVSATTPPAGQQQQLLQHKRSAAAKRLYLHIVHCTLHECFVPGCLKSRKVWAHFCRCEKTACTVCTVISDERARRELRLQHRDFPSQPDKNRPKKKTDVLSPRSTSLKCSPGRPPLSPNKSPQHGAKQALIMAEV